MHLYIVFALIAVTFFGIVRSTTTTTEKAKETRTPRLINLLWTQCDTPDFDQIQFTDISFSDIQPTEGETIEVTFKYNVLKTFSEKDKIIIADFRDNKPISQKQVPICKMNPDIFRNECPPKVGSSEITLKLPIPFFPPGPSTTYSYEYRADLPRWQGRLFCFQIDVHALNIPAESIHS